MGVTAFLMLVSCLHLGPDPCAEVPYRGRHQLDPTFESARASLLAHTAAAEEKAASRVGGMGHGWEVRIVTVDDPVGRPGPAARTTRWARCRVIEIQFAAGNLVFGASEKSRAVLEHELVHAIVYSKVDPAVDVPEWVLEGLAVWGADHLHRKADILLGDYLRKPHDLPSPQSWSPPSAEGDTPADDYFMSGVFLSVALPDRGAVEDFVERLSRVDWRYALEEASGRSFEQNLEAARARGTTLLEAERQAMHFDELTEAMTSSDLSALRAFADDPDHQADDRAWAVADLQYWVCKKGELAACRDLSAQVRQSWMHLSIAALGRAELNLGRALLRAGETDECREVVWSALRRCSTRMSADEVSSALVLLADCHSRGGDLGGFVHVARVASDLLDGTPEHAELMQKLERRARKNGSLREFQAALGGTVVEDSDGAALQ